MPVAPQKKSRLPIIIAVIVAVVVLCGGGLVAFALIGSSVSGTDSGVTACKTLVDDSDDSSTDGDDSSSDALTKADYDKIRGQFADSKHSDLRSSGTKFMDLAWKLGGEDADQDQGLEALTLLGQFESDYNDLAAACKNHGVTLPPLDLSDGE